MRLFYPEHCFERCLVTVKGRIPIVDHHLQRLYFQSAQSLALFFSLILQSTQGDRIVGVLNAQDECVRTTGRCDYKLSPSRTQMLRDGGGDGAKAFQEASAIESHAQGNILPNAHMHAALSFKGITASWRVWLIFYLLQQKPTAAVTVRERSKRPAISSLTHKVL